ncbi:MAG: SH3 domain-containing protein [Gemmobacter sp.]|uniref:SH3 domain-containing protein n=1 Tax=Gemmobacter sp. TaxID=1898957 RepID=UPI0039190374
MAGLGLMRLAVLLAGLGLALYAVMTLNLPAPQDRTAAGETKASPATEPEATRPGTTASRPVLPAGMQRLADAPIRGATRPTILQEAVIDPAAVQPMTASARPEPTRVSALPAGSIRRVTASGANVRGGPSSGHDVVGRLARGEEVEVIEDGANGWLRIRIQGDGIEGWVSARLLAP